MTRMGFKFKTEEVEKLVDYQDSDGDGHLDFEEFSVLVGKAENNNDDDDDNEASADVDDLALMVRKELKRVTRSADGPPKVRKEFMRADRNGDGELGSREFRKCLKDLGFNFKSSDIDKLMNYLDADGDSRISYVEFEDLVTSGDDDDSGDDR